MRTLRFIILSLAITSAVAYVAVIAGYLQEFNGDDIPDLAAKAGVALPLGAPRIEVSLQRGTLSLFDEEVLVKRYNAGSGELVDGRYVNRIGSTPLGEFVIIEKRFREDVLVRGSRFLVFDFPNEDFASNAYEGGGIEEEDYERIVRAAAMMEIPPMDTPLGGPIGIQGNYFFFQQARFTDGSIALGNGDINELYEYVPVGTPVIIAR